MAGLRGRVALVTGGSRGIGAAVARRLAADGADVAVTYVGNATAAAAAVEGKRCCEAIFLGEVVRDDLLGAEGFELSLCLTLTMTRRRATGVWRS